MTFQPQALDELLVRLFPRERISASSLKMFQRCPEQWRRRYILGHKAPPAGALLWGSADHEAVGANYAQKIDTGTDLPVPEVQEMFVASLEQRVETAEDEILWDGKIYAGKTEEQAIALTKDWGASLVGAYQEQVAQTTWPVSVEQEFTLPLDGLPPVTGFIDLTARDEPGDIFESFVATQSVERKTKGSNSAPGPDERFQARVYELVTGLPTRFDVSVKGSSPKVVVHEPEPVQPPSRTIEALRRAVLGIASCFALYGEEQPWPDNGRTIPLKFGMACDLCGYRSSCGWWHEEYWPK